MKGRTAVTAKELTAKIRQLRGDDDRSLWEREIGKGAVLHVRCELQRHFGVFYRVWTTKGTKITAMLFAELPETAGKKARSLVTRHGGSAP